MNARIAIAAVSLLLLGAVAGVSGDRLIELHHGGGGHVVNGRFQGDPVAHLADELSLTAGQRTRISAIFAGSQHRVDAAWVDARARIKVTVDSIIGEVAAQLDSTQLPRFYQLVEEVHGPGSAPFRH